MKTYLPSLTILSLALMSLVTYSFTTAQWTNPPANPPNDNVEAPINIGSVYQAKTGDLGAIRMRASEYCDELGENCLYPTEGSYSGTDFTGLIELGVVRADTGGYTMNANTICQSNGYDGLWAAIDRSSLNEDIICFSSALVSGLGPKLNLRFVTQWDALRRDPAFRAWYSLQGGGTTLPSGGSFRDDRGWGRYDSGRRGRNAATYDKICSFMMENGRWASGNVFSPNWTSDNNNRGYLWDTATGQWISQNYDYRYGLDAIRLNCVGSAVTVQGDHWLLSNRPEGCGDRHLCMPYPIPPMR